MEMFKRLIIVYLGLFLILAPLTQNVRSAQTDSVAQKLKTARSLYYEGKFEKAQDILLTLLKENSLTKKQKLQALIVLAEIRRALNDEPGARKLIQRILMLDPDYKPTIREEPPTFVALVNEERKKIARKQNASFFKRPLFWLVAGGTALTAVTAFLLLKSSGSNILPEPPSWPEQAK